MYIYIAQPNWLLFLEMLLELVIRVNSTKHSPPLIKQSRCYVIFQIYWLSHLWLSHTFLLHIKDKLRNTQALHHLSFKPSPRAQFKGLQMFCLIIYTALNWHRNRHSFDLMPALAHTVSNRVRAINIFLRQLTNLWHQHYFSQKAKQILRYTYIYKWNKFI